MKLDFKTKFKKRKRVGRGISAGGGKTAGRGTKGQKSRSGFKRKRGFEGGQMPLKQRLPKKRGFTKFRQVKFQVVNLSNLNAFKDGELVTPLKLREKGIITKKGPVKILGKGELKKKLKVEVDFLSAKAKDLIKKAGGEIIVLEIMQSKKRLSQSRQKNEKKDSRLS